MQPMKNKNLKNLSLLRQEHGAIFCLVFCLWVTVLADDYGNLLCGSLSAWMPWQQSGSEPPDLAWPGLAWSGLVFQASSISYVGWCNHSLSQPLSCN